jgi:hypothetical protein
MTLCSAVQCDTKQNSTITVRRILGTIRYGVLQNSAVHCSTVQCSALYRTTAEKAKGDGNCTDTMNARTNPSKRALDHSYTA